MKTLNFFTLGLILTQVIFLGCDKPKQRPEVVNTAIQSKLVAIADLHDVTSESSKAYFYQQNTNDEVQKLDKTSQIKIDENTSKVLSMVLKKEAKAVLDAQLKTGLISFVVLPTQIKIFKVVTKSQLPEENKSNSAQSINQLKQLKKASFEIGKMSTASLDVSESKNEIEFIEITAIQIEKTGVLENEKTKYYDEKMSVLNIAERSLDLSTHLLLKAEISTTEPLLEY